MRRGSTWELLGIAPTADPGAIQRAYARKCDDLDADRDPALAIALREAFESARFAAQWLTPEDVPDLPAEATPAASSPARPAMPLEAIAPPAKLLHSMAPPPVVEVESLPVRAAEPRPEPVREQPERPPQQVTIVQPQRRKSPWRPRRPAPGAAAPPAADAPSVDIDPPSFARRLPKNLRLLPILLAGVVAYAILNVFGAFTPAPSIPEPERSISQERPAPVSEPEPEPPTGEPNKSVAEIDRALEQKFGNALDIGRIEARNLGLLAKLEALWEGNVRSGATSEQLAQEVGALADRWYAAGLTSGDVALTTDRARLTIDMAIALRARSRAQCSRFLEGDRRWSPALGLDEALRAREVDLMARTLLDTDGESRPAAPAAIPASLVQSAAQRAGITPEAIRAWLTREARAPENCDIAIAVTEAVLELPDTIRLPILRVL